LPQASRISCKKGGFFAHIMPLASRLMNPSYIFYNVGGHLPWVIRSPGAEMIACGESSAQMTSANSRDRSRWSIAASTSFCSLDHTFGILCATICRLRANPQMIILFWVRKVNRLLNKSTITLNDFLACGVSLPKLRTD
jgi:hypothetical protein